ncbi:S9 family peptidase [Streptomyces sodiiphilus]|uniref:S9 family peptidase n=1 Tax=Streptomyces sodiiphilus TaxID=226217 RepID=A0ABN2PPB6_9ACTN
MTATDARPDEQPDAYRDLDAYVRLPRVEGLRLSPDGRRLVVGVSTPDLERNRYTSALWEVDPEGERPARRLTRGDRGESAAGFTPDGDLLFVSSRPEPGDDSTAPALWAQPSGGGDARVLVRPPGGVRGPVVSESGTVVLGSGMMPSAPGAAADKELREGREKARVSAILHEEFPIRYWDHHLGPDRTRLLAAALPGAAAGGGTAGTEDRPEPRDVTGHVGRALDEECSWDITPDGTTVVSTWAVAEPGGSQRYTVVALDVATGQRRTLADDPEGAHEYHSPRISPDGARAAVIVRRRGDAADPGHEWLGLVPVDGGAPVADLTAGWDRIPRGARWTPDGSALIAVADDHGRAPLWRVDAGTGEVSRLTADDGAYSDIQVSPDGRRVYALRSAVDSPPAPVSVSLDGEPEITALPGPARALGAEGPLPGRLEEVTATAEDGTALRAWLALPHDAGEQGPAPLLLWIHGGPVMSWNAWSWRWNPWIAVAHGYAVLLPDPALSTGYGTDFVRRGWGRWGGAPYTDLMTITDAAVEHPGIDGARTAAMGGSFGGYMANWIAGHTGRFRAIVTHASVWNLEQSSDAADFAYWFHRGLTPGIIAADSPHHHADAITTPMLVIHGDKDYRVPVGEGLSLWWALASRATAEDGSMPHKFLYFPDENHWILTPHHAKVWYQTVLAFIAHHVDGEEWRRPPLLG